LLAGTSLLGHHNDASVLEGVLRTLHRQRRVKRDLMDFCLRLHVESLQFIKDLLEIQPVFCQDEDRFIMLGMSFKLRVLVVCHCYRLNDKVIRLVSARRANRKEAAIYWR
jgi:uncharacterized DUF497 family protein